MRTELSDCALDRPVMPLFAVFFLLRHWRGHVHRGLPGAFPQGARALRILGPWGASLGGHRPMETCGYQGVTSVQWGDPWPGALPKTLAERGSLIPVGLAPLGIFAQQSEVGGLRGVYLATSWGFAGAWQHVTPERCDSPTRLLHWPSSLTHGSRILLARIPSPREWPLKRKERKSSEKRLCR